MTQKSPVNEAADAANVTVKSAMTVLESFLAHIHKFEYERDQNDDIISDMSLHLTERGFFHFIGFIEQFSNNSMWEPGFMGEYLGRMPPCEQWKKLGEEMADWKRMTN